VLPVGAEEIKTAAGDFLQRQAEYVFIKSFGARHILRVNAEPTNGIAHKIFSFFKLD